MSFLVEATSGGGMSVSWKHLAGLSAASALGGIGLLKLKQSIGSCSSPSPPAIPLKWVKVGTVEKLVIYPIKSCQGVEVQEAQITQLGLKASAFLRDRIFLITDSKGNFRTLRQIPKLALVGVQVTEAGLKLSFPEREPIFVEVAALVEDPNATRRSCRIFTDHINSVLDCGDAVGKWLDESLAENGLRLLYHSPESSQRKILARDMRFPHIGSKDTGAFHDETSYMLMTEETIGALNEKLSRPVTHKSFRPCILLSGTPEAYAEDDWTLIRIGDRENGPILKTAMPCARCRVTVVDPETGTPNDDGEPLKTIMTLKRRVGDPTTTELVKDKGILGAHFGLHNIGAARDTIRVGDSIYAALH